VLIMTVVNSFQIANFEPAFTTPHQMSVVKMCCE